MAYGVWFYSLGLLTICGLGHAIIDDVTYTTLTTDLKASTPKILRDNGYQCEIHKVITEDGYYLTLHRFAPRTSGCLGAVLLSHGILESSSSWLMLTNVSLGYKLYNLGYDVWMANFRGNVYSTRHISLSPDDPIFWKWSWHEIGYYDLPAIIDYMLATTGCSKIFNVGHSMGTTVFFVMCSTRPEYNDKIQYMAALGPVVFMKYFRSPVRLLVPFAEIIKLVIDFFTHGALLPRTPLTDFLLTISCTLDRLEVATCGNFFLFIYGYDPIQLDMPKIIPRYVLHFPAGTSTQAALHYAQEIRAKRFQRFDYGPITNLLLYNSTTPPEYNLSLVTAPVSLHYGPNDLLGDPEDVQNLSSRIPNLVGLFRVNFPLWNHLDFLWGRDMQSLVNNDVLQLMQRFGGPSNV